MPGRPEPHCPSVYFALAPSESGGRRLKGTARSEHLRPQTLEFWSFGRLVSSCNVLNDGTWDAPIESESHAAVHAWLRTGDHQVYCGIVNGVPLYVENRLLQCDVTTRDGYVTDGIEFDVKSQADYQIYINGRPAHDAVDFLPTDVSRPRRGRIKTKESLLVLEVSAHDGALVRLPLWRWRSPGFELFRGALRSQRYCDISLSSGNTIRDVVPIHMTVEDDGWRCHARYGQNNAPIAISDSDILDIRIHLDTCTLTQEDKKRKARVSTARTFFKDAPAAFHQPIVIPFLSDKRPGNSRTRCRILLLRPRPLPTDEIYVLAPLAQLCRSELCELIIVDTTQQYPDADLLCDVNFIIVVRYISARWIDEIVRYKGYAQIIYLFDDDIPNAVDTIELPATYRRRLIDVTFCDFQYMLYISDLVVVSSPALAERFSTPKTHLLEPPAIRESKSLDHHLDGITLRVGYHGSSTHYRDLEFLIPILRSFSETNPHVEFDLFGHKRIREMASDLDRVNIIDPLPWHEYKEFVKQRPCHIMLAPLLEHAYNSGKSRVKFCDASSVGAAGIFSDAPIYRSIVDDGINGLLVSNTEEDWLNALRSLAADRDRTNSIASACRLKNRVECSLSQATSFWAELLNLGTRC